MSRVCPVCKKPLRGQVVMCPLCREPYHIDCFEGSWDCVYCTTQINSKSRLSRPKEPFFTPLRMAVIVVILIGCITAVVVSALPHSSQSRPDKISITEINGQLDMFRIGIKQYEKKKGSLSGASLQPLKGGFLSTIPLDPWGREYLFDGQLGLIATLGRDNKPGGSGPDKDCYIYFRKRLYMKAVSWSPVSGILTITFSKPCLIGKEASIAREFIIETDNTSLPLSDKWKVSSLYSESRADTDKAAFQSERQHNSAETACHLEFQVAPLDENGNIKTNKIAAGANDRAPLFTKLVQKGARLKLITGTISSLRAKTVTPAALTSSFVRAPAPLVIEGCHTGVKISICD